MTVIYLACCLHLFFMKKILQSSTVSGKSCKLPFFFLVHVCFNCFLKNLIISMTSDKGKIWSTHSKIIRSIWKQELSQCRVCSHEPRTSILVGIQRKHSCGFIFLDWLYGFKWGWRFKRNNFFPRVYFIICPGSS